MFNTSDVKTRDVRNAVLVELLNAHNDRMTSAVFTYSPMGEREITFKQFA